MTSFSFHLVPKVVMRFVYYTYVIIALCHLVCNVYIYIIYIIILYINTCFYKYNHSLNMLHKKYLWLNDKHYLAT